MVPSGKGYFYHLYGTRVLSDIRLVFPEANDCLDHPEVKLVETPGSVFTEALQGITPQSDEWAWFHYALLPGGWEYARWENLFEFIISPDGERITYHFLGSVSLESFQAFLGQVLPYALVKQGVDSLHATAVVVDGEAVAFVGEDGRGKSSLAASFLQAGYPLLSDDLLRVDRASGGFLAQPGPARIKLFPNIATRFLHTHDGQGVQLHSLSQKKVFPLAPGEHRDRAVYLKCIYLLPSRSFDKAEERIVSLAPREALLSLLAHSSNHREANSLRPQFFIAQRLATDVPVKELRYCIETDNLPGVRDAIVSDLHSFTGHESLHYHYKEQLHGASAPV